MRYLPLFILSIILLVTSCTKDRVLTANPNNNNNNNGDTTLALISYWNFNGSSLLTPTIGNGTLTVPDTYDAVTSTATSINAQNGDVDGSGLRVRNPSTEMVIAVPTTGYNTIILSYAVEASSATNAALTNTISYTLDGINYITTGLSSTSYDLTNTIDPVYILKTVDFSSIAGINNNPNFKVKITFSNGNQNTSGNDRFDNITVKGKAITNTPPPAGNAPIISSAATASGTVGTAFTAYTITASNTPTSFAITNIPAGLSFNTATGVLTGTPTNTGVFTDTIKATNASGTGTQVLTITINAPATIALLHYWNFNATPNFLAPTSSIITGAGLSFDYTTVSGVTGYTDSIAPSSVGSINAQNGDADGNALRVRNPCLDFIIKAPTTGYQNIVLSFAAEASSATKAALTNSISYTTDGTNYITAGLTSTSYSLAAVIDPAYALQSFDFSSIPAVNNNPNFKIKITFSDGNLGTSGNDRFDNITIKGFHQ